jgi:hypothetical protein
MNPFQRTEKVVLVVGRGVGLAPGPVEPWSMVPDVGLGLFLLAIALWLATAMQPVSRQTVTKILNFVMAFLRSLRIS